jgi:excisionase family DNA binding protein
MPTTTTRRRAPRADAPRLTSLVAAAEYLDVNPRTIRRMIAAGRLRAYRVGTHLLKVDMRQVEAAAVPVPPEDVSA